MRPSAPIDTVAGRPTQTMTWRRLQLLGYRLASRMDGGYAFINDPVTTVDSTFGVDTNDDRSQWTPTDQKRLIKWDARRGFLSLDYIDRLSSFSSITWPNLRWT